VSLAGRPLEDRLGGDVHRRPFVMSLMLHGYLHPGYDFLLARRKLPSLWRGLPLSPMAADVERFTAAAALGFTERVRSGIALQAIARLLIQRGRPLAGLTARDFTAFAATCQERQQRDGIGWRHYSGAIHAARQILFHPSILDDPPPSALRQLRLSFEQRMADVPAALRPRFVAFTPISRGSALRAPARRQDL
jgi:hypothetical protein